MHYRVGQPEYLECGGNTDGIVKSWLILDTVDRVHVASQLVRLLVWKSSG